MHRFRSINRTLKNSLKCLKIQYPKKLYMQEVQMALIQEPITQINKFSTEKLANISQTFRLSRGEAIEKKCYSLKFDGKLHLDLKVDRLLIQIQQCKIDLAELLEMYLPNYSNSIQIKQLKLSNLKPTHSQQQRPVLTKQANDFLVINKDKQTVDKQQQQNPMKRFKKINDDKQTYDYLRREDSYQINALEEQQKKQMQAEKDMDKEKKKAAKADLENQDNLQQQTILQKEVTVSKQDQENMQNLFQKKQQGKVAAGNLASQLSQQKVSSISANLAQSQIKNSSEDQLFTTIEKQLTNFKKTLMLREAQLGMLIYITESKHDESFLIKYQQAYESLKTYVIPVQKINGSINVFILEQVFQIQSKFLQQYKKYLQQIVERLKEYLSSQKQKAVNYSLSSFTNQPPIKKLGRTLKSVFKLKIINSKIITMAQVFPYACVKDLNDLFSFSKSHPRWQKLIQNDVIKYKIYGQPQKIRQSFDSLKNNLNIVNASMNILNQSKDLSVFEFKNWGKIFDSTSKILKVALFKNDALHQASVMISQPDSKLAKQIWNLPDNKTLHNFISAVLPAIDFSQKLYIPRFLGSYIKSLGKEDLPQQYYISRITKYGNQLYEKAPYQRKIPCRINAKHRINRKYQTKTNGQKDQLKKNQDKKPQTYSKMFFNQLNSMTKAVTNLNTFFKKQGQNSNTVILHINGGGFISMSSFIHQTYTRNWAKSLEIPILSVDYGKAPEYPYPNGLYDCLQAYMWLRFVFRQIYNVQVQKVIIVGDSAGGNMAAALTTLLIQWGLPKPDGLVLVYPALNLNFNTYTPSLLHALNDMILPHTFLKICLRAYIKDPNTNPETDSLVSPAVTRSQTLKKYPRTKIFVGGKDPFHDDCCRFVERLNQQNQGIADLTIFDQFPHGFLQFDIITNPHQQARKAIKQVQNALKQVSQYEPK